MWCGVGLCATEKVGFVLICVELDTGALCEGRDGRVWREGGKTSWVGGRVAGRDSWRERSGGAVGGSRVSRVEWSGRAYGWGRVFRKGRGRGGVSWKMARKNGLVWRLR